MPIENVSAFRAPRDLDANWWRQAAVYQIYPRSFADANGDGIGDLEGIISRVGYLSSLGVDAVWLSPFYPSALADGGYDIDDYRNVDPSIGTLDQFDALVAALHAQHIEIIIDIVPNHSSNRHQWFKDALAAGPGSTERDRYIFRDGTGPNGENPPADWWSFFGGSAWTRVPDGQWYLHLFTAEQPDFNWKNEDVRADFLTTLKFWGDRGVDGFRIDVATLLSKDLPPELPTWQDLMPGLGFVPGAEDKYAVGQHPFWDRDDLDEIYGSWRKLLNTYSPPLSAIAEAWVAADRRARYAKSDGLGQAFNFDLLQTEWDANDFRRVIRENLTIAENSGASSTWVFSNHDVVRHATRYAMPKGTQATKWLLEGADPKLEDRALGLRRARAATMLAMALPGSVYIYQGEELGLPEVADIPDDRRQDPNFFRNRGKEVGRDGARVPLPWTRDGIAFGFGDAEPHLPQPAWFGDYSVEAELDNPNSTLSMYRGALQTRRQLEGAETLTWIESSDDVVSFQRPDGWVSYTNFGSTDVPLPAGQALFSSEPIVDWTALPADTTVWLRVDQPTDDASTEG